MSVVIPPKAPGKQSGVAMIEILVSVLLLSIGVLGSLGLQARGISAITDAQMRTQTMLVSERIIGAISADYANAANYAYGGTGTVPSVLTGVVSEMRKEAPGAALAVVVTPAVGTNRVQVDITLTWAQKSDKQTTNTQSVRAYVSRAT